MGIGEWEDVCVSARGGGRASRRSLRHCGQLWLSRFAQILPSAGLKSPNEISTQANKSEQSWAKNEAQGIEKTEKYLNFDSGWHFFWLANMCLCKMTSTTETKSGRRGMCTSDQGHKSWSDSGLPGTHLFSRTEAVNQSSKGTVMEWRQWCRSEYINIISRM